MVKKYINYFLYLAWFISLVSMLGSLFFSEVLKLPPCVLCWYQRIFMYPLVFIIPIGILKKDKILPIYVIPISITGGLISLYHNLLYYKVISEALAPCVLGVSCTDKQNQIIGFVSIPLLSLISFITITLLSFLYLRYNPKR